MPRPKSPNTAPASGTPPTQIRLTDSDKAKIEDIRERFGLPSVASAIRYAVETVHRGIEPRKTTRKSQRTA
jgi:hypothetical protein